ncbi:uncharacterized protein ACO6RY_07644 [Pungitius sinensis]
MGKEEKDEERDAERQTDGGEACSSREEEEKQSVMTEEVCGAFAGHVLRSRSSTRGS